MVDGCANSDRMIHRELRAQRKSKRAYVRVSELDAEQLERRRERDRRTWNEKFARMTPEQKDAQREIRRERYATKRPYVPVDNLSPEELAERRAKRGYVRVSALDAEQLERRRERERKDWRVKRARMTPEQLDAQCERRRKRYTTAAKRPYVRVEHLRPDELEKRRAKDRKKLRARRERGQNSKQPRIRVEKRATLTPEQLAKRRETSKKSYHKHAERLRATRAERQRRYVAGWSEEFKEKMRAYYRARRAAAAALRGPRKKNIKPPKEKLAPFGEALNAILGKNTIYAACAAAVPKHLAFHIREDVIHDLIVAVLEGEIREEEIDIVAKSFVSRHDRDSGRWRNLSLDAPIPGMGGVSFKDQLADTSDRGHG